RRARGTAGALGERRVTGAEEVQGGPVLIVDTDQFTQAQDGAVEEGGVPEVGGHAHDARGRDVEIRLRAVLISRRGTEGCEVLAAEARDSGIEVLGPQLDPPLFG